MAESIIPVCNRDPAKCQNITDMLLGLGLDFDDSFARMIQADCLENANQSEFSDSLCPKHDYDAAVAEDLATEAAVAHEQYEKLEREVAEIEIKNEEAFRNAT